MAVLYLLTSPPPLMEGTDAVFQEVTSLRESVPSEALNLCPRRDSWCALSPATAGLPSAAGALAGRETMPDHHLYFSVPYFFPVLRFLRNPIVYTVVASLAGREKPAHVDRLSALRRLVVSNQRDAEVLQSWGLSNVDYRAPRRGCPTTESRKARSRQRNHPADGVGAMDRRAVRYEGRRRAASGSR